MYIHTHERTCVHVCVCLHRVVCRGPAIDLSTYLLSYLHL